MFHPALTSHWILAARVTLGKELPSVSSRGGVQGLE